MNDLLPFLKKLISAPGLSGHESAVRSLIEEAWKPLADQLDTSRLGSLHALNRGSGPEPRPSILLAAHMDAIGLMVKGVVGEFLRVTNVGGIDARVLPGQLVTVHGRQDLPGVVVQPPPRLLPLEMAEGPVPLDKLFIDTGLPSAELGKLARTGDLVSFAQPPIEMGDEILAGHSLDNRASVAALTYCLGELRKRPHAWDAWAVATTQEEIFYAGAMTSAFQLRPSLAVAVDVTFATSPGSPKHRTYAMGEGPTLGWGPNIHPALHKAFKELAERLEIPASTEPIPVHSGTDAFAMQIASEGIPTMVIGIPLRYMHTPVEMVSLKDVARAGRLLAEFIVGMQPDFVEKISWEG
jgi:endoglucanase